MKLDKRQRKENKIINSSLSLSLSMEKPRKKFWPVKLATEQFAACFNEQPKRTTFGSKTELPKVL